MVMSNNSFAILAIDIGTTNLKCSLYNETLECLHSCTLKVNFYISKINIVMYCVIIIIIVECNSASGRLFRT